MARLIPYSRGLQDGSPLAFSLRLLQNSQSPGWLPGTWGDRAATSNAEAGSIPARSTACR